MWENAWKKTVYLHSGVLCNYIKEQGKPRNILKEKGTDLVKKK